MVFPSPLGEEVMERGAGRCINGCQSGVSIPVRGRGYGKFTNENFSGAFRQLVSIPVRGRGYGKLSDCWYEYCDVACFHPR